MKILLRKAGAPLRGYPGPVDAVLTAELRPLDIHHGINVNLYELLET
jgi:hypothetical protein